VSVAVVTDSASDLTPEAAAAVGIIVVPLLVSFGEREYRTGVDISTDEFWRQLTAPGAPFPKTAACSPGAFQQVFEAALAEGADAIVCVTVGGKLSATHKSASIARDSLAAREIHVVDSETASMSQGLIALMAAEQAAAGAGASGIVAELERRRPDHRLYAVLDTLEYLRRGGRISGAQAAIGSVLSVKPIITVEEGVVETADRVRTRSKARERLLELLTRRPIERLAVIHGQAPDIDGFTAELAARAHLDQTAISRAVIGPSVGPHLGPGVYGACVVYRPT
jgi:DegV family protein with EDD domain